MPKVELNPKELAEKFVNFFLHSCKNDELNRAENKQSLVFSALLGAISNCRQWYSGGVAGVFLVTFRFRTSLPRINDFEQEIIKYKTNVPLGLEQMCDLIDIVVTHVSFGRWHPDSSANMYFLVPFLAKIIKKADNPEYIKIITLFLDVERNRADFFREIRMLISRVRVEINRQNLELSDLNLGRSSPEIKFSSSEEESSCSYAPGECLSEDCSSIATEPLAVDEELSVNQDMVISVYNPDKSWQEFLKGNIRAGRNVP